MARDANALIRTCNSLKGSVPDHLKPSSCRNASIMSGGAATRIYTFLWCLFFSLKNYTHHFLYKWVKQHKLIQRRNDRKQVPSFPFEYSIICLTAFQPSFKFPYRTLTNTCALSLVGGNYHPNYHNHFTTHSLFYYFVSAVPQYWGQTADALIIASL